MIVNSEQNPDKSISVLREFLFVFIPFLLFLIVASIIHYYSIIRTESTTIEAREMLNVGLARSTLNTELSAGLTDLKFLATYLSMHGFDQSGHLRTEEMEALLMGFSQQKHLYDQIRFIDLNGNERIRVNYRKGRSRVVQPVNLQNKGDRYYFLDTVNLNEGEVYISRFDLNVENGKIEHPQKPVIRFAMPVYSNEGRQRGILVLNYLGERMLHSFKRSTANILGDIHLLNHDGYWIQSPRDGYAWGFMLPHQRRFSDDYRHAWGEITQRRTGQIRTENGLFSFETVTPVSVANQTLGSIDGGAVKASSNIKRWYVVSRVSPEADVPGMWAFIVQNSPIYVLTLALISIGSWLLVVSRLKYRRVEIVSEYDRRFRNTLEDMSLLSVSVDVHGKVHFCNDAFLKFSGRSREEAVGHDWVALFFVPERHEQMRGMFHGLKQGKTISPELETEIITRNDQLRLVSWHNTLTYDENGTVTGITLIGEDVTEKRRNELQVRKLSRVVDQSPSIVMLTDRRGRIEYINPKFTEVTGYRADEVVGKNPRVLKSGETTDEDYQVLWKTLGEGQVWRGEFQNKRKSGELYWEAAAISALRDSAGVVTNYIAVKEDITEQKRLQLEVEQQQQELAKHQALSAMGRMAGEIAHDLRNPLSSVKMSLQILGREASANQQELKEIGLGQIHYMENILSDMLAYARPDRIKSESVDVERLLVTILKNYQGRISDLSIEVTMESERDIPSLVGDQDKLQRLFSNLISNAIQALSLDVVVERKLSISLAYSNESSAVEVAICDTGVGLGELRAEQLFEPFFTTHAQGTGLGLAIVHQIVEQHQGFVALESFENGQTCASVCLPLGTA